MQAGTGGGGTGVGGGAATGGGLPLMLQNLQAHGTGHPQMGDNPFFDNSMKGAIEVLRLTFHIGLTFSLDQAPSGQEI